MIFFSPPASKLDEVVGKMSKSPSRELGVKTGCGSGANQGKHQVGSNWVNFAPLRLFSVPSLIIYLARVRY